MDATNMDAIELLESDHRTVEELFERHRLGLDTERRREIIQTIVKELSVHAAIEEELFYPTVRDEVPSTEGIVDHGLDEHQDVKQTLAQIERMDPDDPELEELLGTLMQDVRDHVEEEEQQLFPAVRQKLEPEKLSELGRLMAERKQTAPTGTVPGA